MGLNQGYIYRERIGPQAAGATVLDYLCRRYQHSSPETWRQRMEEGKVFLDGSPAASTEKLRAGQTLDWRRPPWQEPDAPLAFAVLYEDRHLLAVAKPRGLPTLPGGGFLQKTLLWLVRPHYPDATPLHRLGRGSSGVLLFARSRLARSSLSAAWQKGGVRRIYRALASGTVKAEPFDIDVAIGPVPHPLLRRVNGAAVSSGDAKPARSRVRLLEHRRDGSLVEVELRTGRPHQIRIHLAAAGHPLVGDPFYLAGGGPRRDARALPGDLGYWLHAERLSFRHPESGDSVTIECPPPPPLRSSAPASLPTSSSDSGSI
ncbi:MAG: RluA family pseudouridine synthase [Acidobacteriota bacterium]